MNRLPAAAMARRTRCRPARPGLPLGWAWLLAVAVVAAQALGLAHRVLHAPALPAVGWPAAAAPSEPANAHAPAKHAQGPHAHQRLHWHTDAHAHELAPAQRHAHKHAHAHTQALAHPSRDAVASAAPACDPGLFDDHAPGGEQCRLLDQAAHADFLAGSGPALGLAPCGLPRPAPPLAARAGGSAAGYHARGPPQGSPRPPPSA